MSNGDVTPKPETGFYEAYSSFSRTLRGWLVAFGIGAPVLFVSQATFADVIKNHKLGEHVILPFLAGIVIQSVMCLFYKYSMFYLYQGEIDPGFAAMKRHRISHWFSTLTWLEVGTDVATMLLFAYATVRLLFAMLT